MPITRRDFLKGVVAGTTLNAAVPLNQVLEDSNRTLEEKLINSWETENLNFISENRNNIRQSAHNQDLPPEFLAALIYNEKTKESFISRTMDNVLLLAGLDPTIGDAQIKISTAAMLDGNNKKLSNKEQHIKYSKLIDTPSNIDYAAKYIRYILDRHNRFPKITSEELLNNPNAMAIVATEYNRGPSKSPVQKAKPNASGLHVVSLLCDNSILYKLFERKLKGEDKRIGEYFLTNKYIGEAFRNHDIESDGRLGRRSAYYTLGLSLLGLGYYIIHRIRNKDTQRS